MAGGSAIRGGGWKLGAEMLHRWCLLRQYGEVLRRMGGG